MVITCYNHQSSQKYVCVCACLLFPRLPMASWDIRVNNGMKGLYFSHHLSHCIISSLVPQQGAKTKKNTYIYILYYIYYIYISITTWSLLLPYVSIVSICAWYFFGYCDKSCQIPISPSWFSPCENIPDVVTWCPGNHHLIHTTHRVIPPPQLWAGSFLVL